MTHVLLTEDGEHKLFEITKEFEHDSLKSILVKLLIKIYDTCNEIFEDISDFNETVHDFSNTELLYLCSELYERTDGAFNIEVLVAK